MENGDQTNGESYASGSITTSPAERSCIGLFLIVTILVGVCVDDLYPLSTMPMFSEATKQRVFIALSDRKGRQLAPEQFDVVSFYYANPYPRIGLSVPNIQPELLLQNIRPRISRRIRKAWRTLSGASAPKDILVSLRLSKNVNGRVETEVRRWHLHRNF
jgi:RNase P protein component